MTLVQVMRGRSGDGHASTVICVLTAMAPINSESDSMILLPLYESAASRWMKLYGKGASKA